ncbi:MAG: hypothetical protein QGG69_07625, partial [Kiritimatiellia bacterium]|nr:hypothetical protein [Kiritimatiellia bacterium]
MGSAGPTAWALVVAGCFLCTALGLLVVGLPNRAMPGERRRGAGLAVWLALGLLAWTYLQSVPWPAGVISRVVPGAAELYQKLLSPGESATIALDAAWARAVLGQWIAYGLLAWVCALGLRSRTSSQILVFGIAGLGAAQAFTAILSGGSAFGWYPTVAGTARGTFSSGNSLGGLLAMTMVLTAALILFVAVRLV